MAGGNRRSGDPAKVAVFIELPIELRVLVELYKDHMRIPTLTEAFRRLLETHPALTKEAAAYYTDGSTSPLT